MLGTAVIRDETDEHAHGTEMKRMWTEGSQGINSEHETRVLRTLPVKSLQENYVIWYRGAIEQLKVMLRGRSASVFYTFRPSLCLGFILCFDYCSSGHRPEQGSEIN